MSRADRHCSAPDAAALFAALGDETRLALVSELSDGRDHSIARLSADKALSRQAVTRHLRVLEAAGLVSSIRIGRESRFRLTPEPLGEIRSYLDRVSAHWDEALGRLKLLVEGPAGEG
ncbi:ArsR/SmtB family transcription factor [Enterovirga aerilata]|uniref:Winged helix-turn-helix transcriptional regulator n=1 Tax=Enterovirga aerilata TaxID=2730920 RepID=A0A849IL93_9HYPH|nr:metalloregulator ArsR/SmtB family transcription factor [Enterovirga sp. DB1703]NNM74723.1 winged helix-turn-helix transcriptional regulator [Enterovirga sp. DB1703]